MRRLLLVWAAILIGSLSHPAWGAAGHEARQQVSRSAENQIRQLLEPLLERYCQFDTAGIPSCKLLQVSVESGYASASTLAPGFDDFASSGSDRLVPIGGMVKLLLDEKIGPVSRGKLVQLVEQYLETLEYPVKVESKTASFPQPMNSVGKVAALRDRALREFRTALDELFRQYCPNQCMLGDVTLDADATNPEETQYGTSGEFLEHAGTAIRINDLSATILIDESMGAEEQASLLEMARLRTSSLKNVTLSSKVIRFPQIGGQPIGPAGLAGATGGIFGRGRLGSGEYLNSQSKSDSATSSVNNSTNSSSTNSASSNTSSQDSKSVTSNESKESSARQERFERFEKIERVENGDAVQKELEKFKVFGLIIAAVMLALLGVLTAIGFRQSGKGGTQTILSSFLPSQAAPATAATELASSGGGGLPEERMKTVAMRYEIERMTEELSKIYAETPKVAKVVFSRVLTEEGVETTSAYMQIFGEGIVVDMLRDPSLQRDLNELTEYFARNSVELSDEDKLDLLRRLHHRTVAGKLIVLGNRSSNLFDFLVEMDGLQIAELVRTESMTVKAIVVTQCDAQKRNLIFQQFDEPSRLQLMAELSRIDYLPRDYIANVAQALKRKRRENPKLNTEALPGSDVLVGLLERSDEATQRSVLESLGNTHPESARTVMGKLVSVETLRYLRDSQLLEVVLSLKHEELLQFLRGTADEVRKHIFSKAPKDLVAELEDELESLPATSREAYQVVERKVLNRIKLMAGEGALNLAETNERMFADARNGVGLRRVA